MHHEHAKKSTNVRFPILLFAILASCTGCAGAPALEPAWRSAAWPGAQTSCAPATQRVCERFGPTEQCECARSTDIDGWLASFGQAAWLGAAR
jgi:hypothetical protein